MDGTSVYSKQNKSGREILFLKFPLKGLDYRCILRFHTGASILLFLVLNKRASIIQGSFICSLEIQPTLTHLRGLSYD